MADKRPSYKPQCAESLSAQALHRSQLESHETRVLCLETKSSKVTVTSFVVGFVEITDEDVQ